MFDLDTTVLHDVEPRFHELRRDRVVANSELKPDRRRAAREELIKVPWERFGSTKYDHDIRALGVVERRNNGNEIAPIALWVYAGYAVPAIHQVSRDRKHGPLLFESENIDRFRCAKRR